MQKFKKTNVLHFLIMYSVNQDITLVSLRVFYETMACLVLKLIRSCTSQSMANIEWPV